MYYSTLGKIIQYVLLKLYFFGNIVQMSLDICNMSNMFFAQKKLGEAAKKQLRQAYVSIKTAKNQPRPKSLLKKLVIASQIFWKKFSL